MKIRIDNNSVEGVHHFLAKKLKSKFEKNGFEYKASINSGVGEFSIKSYDFDKGFSYHVIQGNITSIIELEFNEDQNNCLRYIFVKQGELIHKVSPAIRYRLTDNYSCMVAAKNNENQLFTLPAQGNIEIYFLQIETKSFSIDLKSDFFHLPQEIGSVFKNEKMDSHFIYHSLYTLEICDTISELTNPDKEGVIKRFFIESKALELLWLQTEQYKKETSKGYKSKFLKKHDVSIIKKAKSFIHENLNEPLTHKLVANAVGTNETKLKTGFKTLFGKNFSEILRHERMNKAKALLEEGDLNIKEISHSCGYKSHSMFTKRFKERFGVNPMHYNLT